MNTSKPDKTEQGSKRRESIESTRIPSISLPEGSGAIRRMDKKLAAHPVIVTGFMTPHHRSKSLICHGTKNILRAVLTGESTVRHKPGLKDIGLNPRQAGQPQT